MLLCLILGLRLWGARGANQFARLCKNDLAGRRFYDGSRSTLDRRWGTRALNAARTTHPPRLHFCFLLFSTLIKRLLNTMFRVDAARSTIGRTPKDLHARMNLA